MAEIDYTIEFWINRLKQQTSCDLCDAEWFTKHAAYMSAIAKPNDIRRGRAQQCFWNAYDLVMRNEGLRYCEGLVETDRMALHHGWVIDEADQVIDNTLTGRRQFKGITVHFDPTKYRYYGSIVPSRFHLAKLFLAHGKKPDFGPGYVLFSNGLGVYPRPQTKAILAEVPKGLGVADPEAFGGPAKDAGGEQSLNAH